VSTRTEAERTQVVRATSQDHLRLYVDSDGKEGYTLRGVPCLILTTVGRRTGEARSVPLIFGQDGENYLLVASLGGATHHPTWYLNLRDNPAVQIQVKDRHMAGRARTATGEERTRLWDLMVEVFPTYASYQARTEREIPVVVVEPVR